MRIYVHNSVNTHLSTNNHLPQNLTNIMFVEISKTTTKSLIVGVIHRSPSSSLFHNENLNEMIDNLHKFNDDIIFVSDWNYAEINWKLKQSMMSASILHLVLSSLVAMHRLWSW